MTDDRKPYTLKMKDIEALVTGLMTHGPDVAYDMMKTRASINMMKSDTVDDTLMDICEGILQKARELEPTTEEEVKLQKIYYTLAEMSRQLAHEVYRTYLKSGKERDNPRFIRLAFVNENPPYMR